MARPRNHRYDYRRSFLHIFIFAMMFTISFLTMRGLKGANAGVLDGFNPGNIISDYVMSNYTSMTEAEIQAFLKSKNHCNNTDIYLANYYPWVTYSIKDGLFVCMADDLFDDGNGGKTTAAHLIWQAAQDYRINPQVLIVLLQKEQGLITDTWPNSVQYRGATGFGCPDTAPCDAEYYGLKNQLENAAWLFRAVLDGGWTNYPVGWNYVQYNPNKACGGTNVYIENRATSSLYRYTPYQPNTSALAAGYGLGDACGAYGNRNFYLYFTEWFGNPQSTYYPATYTNMDDPRLMVTKQDTITIPTNKPAAPETVTINTRMLFTQKTYVNGELCLKSQEDINNGVDRCYRFSHLKSTADLPYVGMDTPRYFFVKSGTEIINTKTGAITTTTSDQRIKYVDKVIWDNQLCLRSEQDARNNTKSCVLFGKITNIETATVYAMQTPRVLIANQDISYIDADTGLVDGIMPQGTRLAFDRLVYLNNRLCLLMQDQKDSPYNKCVYHTDLGETLDSVGEEYFVMDTPRIMRVSQVSDYITTSGILTSDSASKGEELIFYDKTYIDNRMCLRTRNDAENNIGRCVLFDQLSSMNYPSYYAMDAPRSFIVNKGITKINTNTHESSIVNSQNTIYFIDKTIWNGELCLRAQDDYDTHQGVCYLFSQLTPAQ